MELNHLTAFRTVAEYEHMTQAANRLNVAQPALSKIIRGLEDELGVPLFDRVKRRICLNDNGRILLDCANEVNEQLQMITSKANRLKNSHSEVITILLKSTPMVLPRLIQEFSEYNPHITFQLLTFNKVLNEEQINCDFMVTNGAPQRDHPHMHILLDEEKVLAVPPDHRFAGKCIDFSEAANESFITLPSNTNHYMDLLAVSKEAGFTPHVVTQTSDYYTILKLVEAHFGVALIPKYSWGIDENAGISFATISSPRCRNITQLYWEDHFNSPACKRFWKYITETVLDPDSFR